MAGNLDIGVLTGRIRFTANTRDANANMQRLGKTIKQQESAQKRLVSALNRADQKRQDTIRSVKKSTLSHQEQNEQIRKVNAAYQTMRNNAENIAQSNLRGVKAQNAFNNAVSDTKRNIRDQAEATKELNKHNDEANPILARMTKNFNKLAGKMRVMAFTVGTLSAAVISLASELETLGAIAAGVLVDIQFDAARQRLNSFNDSVKATRQQLDRFTDIAANAGVRITAVTDGMADFSAAARSAGLSLSQTNGILNAFTQAQSDFGGSSDEVNKTLEDLAGLAKQSTLTMKDLRDSIEFTNNPLQVLSKSFNTSEREIRKMIESGDELTTQSLLPLAKQLENQTEASDGLAASFNRLVATVTELVREFNQMGVIDSIINQMDRLRDFLETPAGAELITGLADAANHMINETLPNLVNSVRNNWDSILQTIKGVVGFLIGAAVGGAPGGLIGALIGATGKGAETFGLLASAAQFAATNVQSLTAAIVGLVGIGMMPILSSWVSSLRNFVSAAGTAGVAIKGLRIALGGVIGIAVFEGISAIAKAFGFMSSAAAEAKSQTDGVLQKVKDLAETSSQSRINQFSRIIEDASREQENLNNRLLETKQFLDAIQSGQTNVQPPEALQGVGIGQLKEQTKERINSLQQEIEKRKEAKQIAREQIQEEEKRLKKLKEQRDALENVGTDLSSFDVEGDPFSDQVKNIENFIDRVKDLKQSISDIRVRISGGNVPEDLRDFTQDLQGMSRMSLRDVGVQMGLFSEDMNPQVLASRKQLIQSLTEEVKRLLNVKQEESAELFIKEETEQLRRQTAAYKAGEDAIKRYNIRKQIAAKTGQKFAEVESEQITRLKQEKEAAEDAKEEYQRFQQMKQQLGDAVGDSLTDAVVSANSLSEALNDLGKQIARIIMQKGVSEPLANAVSTGIGNMFSNNTTSTTGVAANVGSGNMKGKAQGGTVMGGRSYVVGERGPEVFTPGTSGDITSNESLSVMSSRSKGSAGSDAPIINIYNEGGGEAEVEESTDGSGRSVIDIIIPAVQSGIQQGKLDKSMTNRFQGLQPRVKGR